MSEHQQKPNALELWAYFQSVMTWTGAVFPNYRKEMKGVAWGIIYNEFKDTEFDPRKLESKISKLMQDEDVTKKSGAYEYVLSGREKHLSIRAFNDKQKRETYERQDGICTHCKKRFDITEMEADHVTPWHSGGRTTTENCQMLCKNCNRTKSGE